VEVNLKSPNFEMRLGYVIVNLSSILEVAYTLADLPIACVSESTSTKAIAFLRVTICMLWAFLAFVVTFDNG
jgi:hypothetical protein